MIKYNYIGVPPDIPPGEYALRVLESSHWEGGDMVIDLEYVGPLTTDNKGLFTLNMAEEVK